MGATFYLEPIARRQFLNHLAEAAFDYPMTDMRISGLLIQALRFLGKEHVTQERLIGQSHAISHCQDPDHFTHLSRV